MKINIILRSLLLIALIGSTVFAAAAPPKVHYALFIDAGSQGSRLHLFEYTQEAKIPFIRELFSESTQPGLSFYAAHPQAAGASLKKLLDDALVQLKKNQIDPAKVTISVLGTGGLRLLPSKQQDAIYKSVSLFLKNNYPLRPDKIKSISGKLEGLFGWLDLNYLLKNFDSKGLDTTKGSIDMGGASTQIAFSTADNSKPGEEFTLHIGEHVYYVYSKSFLGLGLVEALKQINTQPAANACYPVHYPRDATQQGSFHFAACAQLYADLIKQQVALEQLPTLANKDFVAFSGIYYTEKFFAADKKPSKEQLTAQVQTICSQAWEAFVAAYPTEPKKYLATYCANGVYLSELLYNIYQLQERQLTVTTHLDQQELDWTLGALLYQLVRQQR